MANKAFEIQESTLRIGGLDLQAGTTSIVIPGVTQATSYRVEEVEETGEQDNTLNLPIVIDNVTHAAKVENTGTSVTAYATYSVELDDEDYVDEIQVNTAGTYINSEVDRNADFDMWGYTGSDAEGYLTNWVTGDWIQIPFRPKMRAGEVENVGGTGAADRLVNGNNELVLNETGHLTFPDGSVQVTAFVGAADNNIWIETFASDAPSTDFVQTATSVEYDADGNVFALLNHYVPGDNDNTYTSVAKLTPTGAILWQVRLSAALNTDGWGLAYYALDNFVYVAGRLSGTPTTYDLPTLMKIQGNTGTVDWSKTYDFGVGASSAVVDVASDGHPVMVGYGFGPQDNFIHTTKIDYADGSVMWSEKVDGQGDEEAYGMAVGSDGTIVTVGYMDQYTEPASYPVTPLTGSTISFLVINRSDLSDAVFTDTWQVAGTGISGYAGISAINLYNAVSGTTREGSGAVFDIADNGDGTYYTAGIQNNGTNYLPGHKILVLGTALGGATPANDCVVTVDSISGNGEIFNWSVTGTAAGTVFTPYTAVTGTNYQVGSGLSFDFFMDAGSTYTEHNTNIIAGGTNYVTGDVVRIPGTQLGGTTPENDLIATVSATNGVVTQFNSFSGNAQTTTYRVAVEDPTVDFGGAGSWTLEGSTTDTANRMIVIKYYGDGEPEWKKAIQFDAGFDCSGADADIDADGNIYVCGSYEYTAEVGTTSAMNLVKFNNAGVKQWSRRVVGNCDTFGTSIVVGDDGYLYLSGVTANNNASDYTWVIAKYDTSGTVVWQRLIDNTTTWTFGGTTFFTNGGGSNIAVNNGYIALAGTFGDPGTQPLAVVLQLDTDATPFSVGDWDIKGATFSGTLNGTASDITVVNANKTSSIITPTVADQSFSPDSAPFLTITRYALGSAGTGDITFDGVKIIGATTDNEVNAGGIKLIPNIAYEGTGQYVKIYPTMGQDAPHIHMAAGSGGDLLIGDDSHYVDVNHNGDIIIKAETDNGNRVRNLVENFKSTSWSGNWASAEWANDAITFVQVNGSVKRWIIKYLDKSRVLGRSLIINNNVNLTYTGYSELINGGFIIFVSDPAPSVPTAVTDLSVGCTLENYLDIDADVTDINLITRSNWDINISAGYENDVRISAGDDIAITAGTKITSDTGGGYVTIQGGDGGAGDHNDGGGTGGQVNIYGGDGGEGSSSYSGGIGANITISAGTGGTDGGAGGGAGGTLELSGGTSNSNTAGGNIYLRPGTSPTSGSGLVSIETVSTASVTNTWQFTKAGDLTLPVGGDILNSTGASVLHSGAELVGEGSAQVGSSLIIADDGNGGLVGWSSTALAVAYNADIISTYPAGSTITWQDGTTATITGLDSYAPNYIDIFWDTPKSGTLFPITLKTDNFVAYEPVTARITATGKQWTFTEDGTTTLPGALVKSTVAKTGVDLANIGKGRAATVTVSPSNNTNLTVGTATGVAFASGFTLDITVAGNGDISAVVTASNQAQSVGDTGTLLGGGALGGTTPADDVVFTVATLTDVIVPTVLDLTKQIQKLTTGVYTLADGVEGQIMYLVRQTGAAYNAIRVNVDNARVDGVLNTTIDYYPFETSLNMSTLIFTDGAWQASVGGWD